jgi:hypothetical protein
VTARAPLIINHEFNNSDHGERRSPTGVCWGAGIQGPLITPRLVTCRAPLLSGLSRPGSLKTAGLRPGAAEDGGGVDIAFLAASVPLADTERNRPRAM